MIRPLLLHTLEGEKDRPKKAGQWLRTSKKEGARL